MMFSQKSLERGGTYVKVNRSTRQISPTYPIPLDNAPTFHELDEIVGGRTLDTELLHQRGAVDELTHGSITVDRCKDAYLLTTNCEGLVWKTRM